MTYWYTGVQETIREVRRMFPDVPVLLGGIYATLMPQHAVKYSGADVVITGESEGKVVSAVKSAVGCNSLDERNY